MGESGTPQEQEGREFAEEQSSLWLIALGPLVWAAHFALSYASVAVFCARMDQGSLLPWRLGSAALTALALALIAGIGWRAWKQWDLLSDYEWSQPDATGEHRHEFLGHAALLLCGASFIGVLYGGLPALFIETCR